MNLARSAVATVMTAALALGAAQTYEQLVNPPAEEWPMFGRDVRETRFSPLDQINRSNVENLGLVWARDLGFQQGHQGSPVVWDGVMYVSTQTGVIALDATNGDVIWEYSKPNDGEVIADSAVRGSPVVFDGKVFFNTRYGMTVAVDAKTGEEVWAVQITDKSLNEGFSTNPIFGDGKLIVSRTGADSGGAPGKIHALDVENGEILWTFNTVPLDPSNPAYDTWQPNPPSWETGVGGGSAWNAGAYDPETNSVVYGTGQPTPWDRVSEARRDPDGEVSADLYTSSFVSLDVDTGELNWYHQIVPGDEWDYDQHTVPMFVDLEVNGEERRAVIAATTTGFVMVFDAETGEVYAGNQVAEETTVHLGFDEDWNPIINPAARFEEVGEYFRVCPHFRWAHIAPAAFSPETGLYYRPNQMGCSNYGADVVPEDWEPGEQAWRAQAGPRDETYWFDNLGQLTAVDPLTGEVVWEWGTDYGMNSGPVATAGGLVMFTNHDRRFRALDAETGEVLFEQVLTAGSQGGTITYAVDGVQYVASIVGFGTPQVGLIPDYNPNEVSPPVAGNAAVFVFALDQ
ncbi:MAG TPA: PQQ-binding-like beta-propeller repeat protein [Trueperaceae bacterium]